MESIINKNENNNLNNQLVGNIKKTCPFCKNIIRLEDYQDHILCHELDQFENRNFSNNVNDFGMESKNEDNSQKENTPQFFNLIKTKFNQLINNNNDNDNDNENDNDNDNNSINNNMNNINNNNNINNMRNINNINIINNNINNNNRNNANNTLNINYNNSSDEDDNDSEDNIDKIKNKVMPVISKIGNFFKGFSKKNDDSDDSNSSDNESIIRIPRLSNLRFISGRRRRRRSNSLNDIPNIDFNDNNNNNRNDRNDRNDGNDDLLEDILNDIKLNDDYKEILRYIPTSTVKEIRQSSENNKCVICLSEFQIGEQESTLPCLHFFHSNCIEKWITEKKWCPVCKYDISLKSLLSENNF